MGQCGLCDQLCIISNSGKKKAMKPTWLKILKCSLVLRNLTPKSPSNFSFLTPPQEVDGIILTSPRQRGRGNCFQIPAAGELHMMFYLQRKYYDTHRIHVMYGIFTYMYHINQPLLRLNHHQPQWGVCRTKVCFVRSDTAPWHRVFGNKQRESRFVFGTVNGNPLSIATQLILYEWHLSCAGR